MPLWLFAWCEALFAREPHLRFGKISDRELVYDYLITAMECSYDRCPLEEAEIIKKKRYSKRAGSKFENKSKDERMKWCVTDVGISLIYHHSHHHNPTSSRPK